MLRQDNPARGMGSPPRARSFRYVPAWNGHVRRRVRWFRLKHDGIGWALVICVISVGVGWFIGH
jgi:hypothetical protein